MMKLREAWPIFGTTAALAVSGCGGHTPQQVTQPKHPPRPPEQPTLPKHDDCRAFAINGLKRHSEGQQVKDPEGESTYYITNFGLLHMRPAQPTVTDNIVEFKHVYRLKDGSEKESKDLIYDTDQRNIVYNKDTREASAYVAVELHGDSVDVHGRVCEGAVEGNLAPPPSLQSFQN